MGKQHKETSKNLKSCRKAPGFKIKGMFADQPAPEVPFFFQEKKPALWNCSTFPQFSYALLVMFATMGGRGKEEGEEKGGKLKLLTIQEFGKGERSFWERKRKNLRSVILKA